MSLAETSSRARMRRRIDADRLLTLACIGLPLLGLILFFAYPMVIVFLRSITVGDSYGLGNYTEVLGSSGFWRATRHSLAMGGATTALSVFLGFIIAHGLYRCAFRGKWLIRSIIVLPLLAPSLVQALGLIFLLLFMAFSSIRYAALIFLNVPFAITGGIFALWISGLYLSVPGAVGFIAVFGVAVLNGVVMVSYINELRARGRDIDEAVRVGAERRLRPVLMTASVAILGLVPLLLADGIGSNVQRPLAAVVVGGLITSTLLTLLVLPAVYRWFAEPRTDVEVSPLKEMDS